jgi:hypothetical protein
MSADKTKATAAVDDEDKRYICGGRQDGWWKVSLAVALGWPQTEDVQKHLWGGQVCGQAGKYRTENGMRL